MPHLKYKIKEKRLIIAEAHQPGAYKKAVARRWGVQAGHIRRWTAMQDRRNMKTLHQGPERIHGELFEEVYNWFAWLRSEGVAVKLRMCVDKYTSLLRQQEGAVIPERHALTMRVWRYLQSEHLCERRGTHIAQNITFSEMVITDYQVYINTTIRLYGFTDREVFNADEINV